MCLLLRCLQIFFTPGFLALATLRRVVGPPTNHFSPVSREAHIVVNLPYGVYGVNLRAITF